MHTARHSQGLTLLEILICLTLIGLLAVFSLPALHEVLETQALITTAEAINADLRWAKSEALKRNDDIQVTFTPGATGNWGYQIQNSAQTLLKTIDATQTTDFKAITLSENLRNDSTVFSRIRGTSEGQNGTLTLVGASGNYELHVVLSNLGRVYICSAKGKIGAYPKCS